MKTWDTGEGDIQVDGELFASALINDNRGFRKHFSIVQEFEWSESEDDCGGDKRH